MKPINLDDVEDIAERTVRHFRDIVSRIAERRGRRRPASEEIDRIAAMLEQTMVEKLMLYVREYESVRGRETLVPRPRE